VTAGVLAVYAVLLAAAAAVVWRRPVVALYIFIVALPLHNIAMSLLYGGGVRGHALDAVQAWKEILLAVALASVVRERWSTGRRQLPRPTVVDVLALLFALVVCIYAVVPQSVLGGHATHRGVLYGARHDLTFVVAYFLGRAVRPDLRRVALAAVAAAAALAVWGLVEVYSVPIEWWRHSGAVGYFHRELGFDYHGPGGLPENFAFNTSSGLFRRLVSTFVSPLAAGYMFVVALLLATALLGRGMSRLRTFALGGAVAVTAAGLFWTFSRSSLAALAVGLLVLALVLRRWWPVPVAALVVVAGVAWAAAFPSLAPRTHWFKSDLPYQEEQARHRGPLPTGSGLKQTATLGEPSIHSHLESLRAGIRTVLHHPQGFGLGNAGATAARFDVPLEAGESNYTEIAAETGLLGGLLFLAWVLALLVGLARAAWAGDRAAAAVAAALAAVLALAVQTDVVGVPWIAYCLFWLAGAAVAPLGLRRHEPAPTSRRRPASSGRERAAHANGSAGAPAAGSAVD
jgi:hypothetical protein